MRYTCITKLSHTVINLLSKKYKTTAQYSIITVENKNLDIFNMLFLVSRALSWKPFVSRPQFFAVRENIAWNYFQTAFLAVLTEQKCDQFQHHYHKKNY